MEVNAGKEKIIYLISLRYIGEPSRREERNRILEYCLLRDDDDEYLTSVVCVNNHSVCRVWSILESIGQTTHSSQLVFIAARVRII